MAILKQCGHFTLTKKPLDLATRMLGLNKSMDFMESSTEEWLVRQREVKTSQALGGFPNLMQNSWWQVPPKS
jgi:hypothetical protein